MAILDHSFPKLRDSILNELLDDGMNQSRLSDADHWGAEIEFRQYCRYAFSTWLMIGSTWEDLRELLAPQAEASAGPWAKVEYFIDLKMPEPA